jgi:hypothetical protein
MMTCFGWVWLEDEGGGADRGGVNEAWSVRSWSSTARGIRRGPARLSSATRLEYGIAADEGSYSQLRDVEKLDEVRETVVVSGQAQHRIQRRKLLLRPGNRRGVPSRVVTDGARAPTGRPCRDGRLPRQTGFADGRQD